jgi:GH24 family phage-related lysozyme (muramidase)
MITLGSKGLFLLKSFEGCKLTPYLDIAGIPTVGYGSTHYADGQPVMIMDAPISLRCAEKLLSHECAKTAYAIARLVHGGVALTPNQADALICFTYNVGVTAFASSSLLKNINGGVPVAETYFTRWDKVHDPKTGELHESAGLLRRRKAEYALYSSTE